MPTTRIVTSAALALALIAPMRALPAQEVVPPAVAALANTDLEAAQKTLKELGYRVVNQSFFAREQTWRSSKAESCVTLKLEGSTITAVSPVATKQCAELAEAARKAAVGVANGEADVHSASIDAERKRLASQGYTVQWSHTSITPDTGSEWWLNAATQTCMVVSWTRKTGEILKTRKAEKLSYCENPYF